MFENYDSLRAARISQRDTTGMMTTCKCWGKNECKHFIKSTYFERCMYFVAGEFCDKVPGKN